MMMMMMIMMMMMMMMMMLMMMIMIIVMIFHRSGMELVSGHSHHRDKPSFGVKSGVKKLFPLNRSITTIPEDLQTPSQDEE